MERMTLADFTGREGTAYRTVLGDAELDLVLEKVTELPQSPRVGGGFTLEFRGPAEPIAPQAIYPLEDDGRTVKIFIVPIGRDEKGTLYEAVFF
jgi:hypothetical protein